jgi:hypothetical protein|tara:strand:+ start:991 stop:1314 length:324 start_codon:yes stop_codon:yes gene_type:complete
MLKLFKHNLENIEYPSQKKSWDIAGIIKGHNGFYKFDTRPLQKTKEGELGKYSSFNSEADKMVFEIKDKWIIVDLKELYAYLKNNKLKKVYLQDLIFKLDWNITISK